MNNTRGKLPSAVESKVLAQALRGECCVFSTPATINDDMRPTDHDELLERWLYPLAREHGGEKIQDQLSVALRDICSDALGVFCAHQCFYIEMVKEKEGISPLSLDRRSLPRFLASKFLQQSPALHDLELRPGDLISDRSYKVVVSGMRILARDYGIDWDITIPT